MVGLDPNWIRSIDGLTLLRLLDVTFDIESEFNLSPNKVEIPIHPNRWRFRELKPTTSEGLTEYHKSRLKACTLLRDRGVLREISDQRGGQLWQRTIRIFLNAERFREGHHALQEEYRGRTASVKPLAAHPWDQLHPKVVEVARPRYESGLLADAVEASLKLINAAVKKTVKAAVGEELDGAALMNRAFSIQHPILVLDDLQTKSGADIQKGYMQIFAGAMIGVRNPKAHDNIIIDQQRAVHLLYLASLLMYKLDESSTNMA